MKKNERRIIVIGALILRKAHYVKTADRRADGQYIVNLTQDLSHAKEFPTRMQAQKVNDRIFNPYDRIYAVEERVVDWPKRAVTSLPGDLE